MLESVGYGTVVTKNHLPDGSYVVTTFKRVLHVPDFGVCTLPVKHLASRESGGGVYWNLTFMTEKENLSDGVPSQHSTVTCTSYSAMC